METNKITEALRLFTEAEAQIRRAKALLRKGEHKPVQLDLFAEETQYRPSSVASRASKPRTRARKPLKSAQPTTRKAKLACLERQPQKDGWIKLEHARNALGIGHLHDNSRLRAMIDAGVLVPVTIGGKAVGVTVASVRKAINKGL